MENWGDHQEKKFYMDNAVHALHLFKEGHQILLKLHVHLGRELYCGKTRKEFSPK